MPRLPCPTDVSDADWAILEPLLPAAKRLGRPRADLRQVFNAIRFVTRSGAQWRMVPHDLVAWGTAWSYFRRRRGDGTWQRVHDAVRANGRRADYRNGELIEHKVKADQDVEYAEKNGAKIDKVLIWRRYAGKYSSPTPIVEGRDCFVDDLLKQFRGAAVDPVSMPAEAPLFLMYTSGTTASPRDASAALVGSWPT